jgi:hypothetical protein
MKKASKILSIRPESLLPGVEFVEAETAEEAGREMVRRMLGPKRKHARARK